MSQERYVFGVSIPRSDLFWCQGGVPSLAQHTSVGFFHTLRLTDIGRLPGFSQEEQRPVSSAGQATRWAPCIPLQQDLVISRYRCDFHSMGKGLPAGNEKISTTMFVALPGTSPGMVPCGHVHLSRRIRQTHRQYNTSLPDCQTPVEFETKKDDSIESPTLPSGMVYESGQADARSGHFN